MRKSPSKTIELNEFGLAVWRKDGTTTIAHHQDKKSPDLTIVETGKNRIFINVEQLDKFDFTGWTPLTKEEYIKYLDRMWK